MPTTTHTVDLLVRGHTVGIHDGLEAPCGELIGPVVGGRLLVSAHLVEDAGYRGTTLLLQGGGSPIGCGAGLAQDTSTLISDTVESRQD